MPTFVLAYRNPADYAPSQEATAAWMAWFDAIGEPQTPTADRWVTFRVPTPSL